MLMINNCLSTFHNFKQINCANSHDVLLTIRVTVGLLNESLSDG